MMMMETGRLCAFFYTGYCEMVSVFSSSYFFGCFGAYEVPLFKKRNGCVRFELPNDEPATLDCR